VDIHSKQRNFRTSDIPVDIKPNSIKWDQSSLEVTWENDIPGFDSSHTSRYAISELDGITRYSVTSDTGLKRHRVNWDGPLMEELQHWVSYEDYMNNGPEFTRAMRNLSVLGLIFVKDVPDSREMVEKLATRIGPLRNTFYGPTWDVRTVPQAKNVAYTSQFLGFHMDLMYMRDPPGYQFLHCLRNSCDGGESLFADAFHAAAKMHNYEREYFDALTKTNLSYSYLHEDSKYCQVRPVFDVGADRSKGSLLEFVNYSPPFQGPKIESMDKAYGSVGWQKMEIEALQAFAKRLESETSIFELKLNPGECVIFENRRVVHARRQFNTAMGERWLAGAYLDTDVVQSRFRVQKEADPGAWTTPGGTSED
jgi:alpha-ketoglutarate-dependent taurine dioxygenase